MQIKLVQLSERRRKASVYHEPNSVKQIGLPGVVLSDDAGNAIRNGGIQFRKAAKVSNYNPRNVHANASRAAWSLLRVWLANPLLD
jgi:hypothetical protein